MVTAGIATIYKSIAAEERRVSRIFLVNEDYEK